jgi:hypothetical protein
VTASVEPVPVVELDTSSVVTLVPLVGVVVASVALAVVVLPVPDVELPAAVVAVEPSSPHPARSEASVRRPAKEGLRRVKRTAVKRTVGRRSPAMIPREPRLPTSADPHSRDCRSRGASARCSASDSLH